MKQIALMVVLGLSTASPVVAQSVVNNPAPSATAPSFRIADKPTITVGGQGATDAGDLFSVAEAAITTTGHLIIVHNRRSEIREYDRASKRVAMIGKAGAGPGEYRGERRIMALPGDSLLLYDNSLQRVTIFGPDRKYVRSVEVRGTSVCCTGNGAYLTGAPGASMNQPVAVEWRIANLKSSASAAELPRISLPTAPRMLPVTVSGRTMLAPTPFTIYPIIELSDRLVVSATGDSYEYRQYALDGTLVRTVKADAAPHPISNEQREQALANFGPKNTNEMMRDAFKKAFDEAELPKSLPAFGAITVEEDGTTWVGSYAVTSTDTEWWAKFDGSGVLKGTLVVPRGKRILAFSRGQAVVVETDPSNDLQTVSVFPIMAMR